MPEDRHVVTGVEPAWVRTKYERTAEGVVPVRSLAFEERVRDETAEYECSCGTVIEGYEAMIDHLERAGDG